MPSHGYHLPGTLLALVEELEGEGAGAQNFRSALGGGSVLGSRSGMVELGHPGEGKVTLKDGLVLSSCCSFDSRFQLG